MSNLHIPGNASEPGQINVKSFGASGSALTTTGTATAGSATLTLAAALDFQNGQGVAIAHAGAVCSLTTPAGLTVAPTGTAGTTTYQYQIVAIDVNEGCTAANTAVSTTTGNAILSSTNYNVLSWTAVTNAVSYAIYGRVSGTMNLLAIVTTTSWNDVGSSAITVPWYLPSSPPASSLADSFIATINSGAGTTSLTLSANVTTAVTSQTVMHDETNAIQNAVNSATVLGKKEIYFPNGSFSIQGTLTGMSGITFVGDGALFPNSGYSSANVTQITNRLNGHFINVLYPPSPLVALNGNGVAENMANVQAIFDSIQNTGGIIFFPGNKRYVFTSTITIHDGTTVLGAGKNPTNGYPTILDFKAITGTSAGFLINGGSDINLKDFYMYGTTTGSGNDISMTGYNRRINIENIILNTKTTGYGICAGAGGTGGLITSVWKNILVTGAGTGYFTASSCTSISLYNCYANSCTQYGYIIEGTYCSLHSCASDLNGLYGYVLQNANQVGLYSCGGESNVRGAVTILTSTGIDILSFRSHNNNTGASTFFPSFMDIQNSNQILLSNCQDSSPNASTTFSLTSTTQDSGANIVILNPNFGKPIYSRLLNVPRIDGAMYPGVVANTVPTNNGLFIDSADNRLKLKDNGGNINVVPLRLQSATAVATITGGTITSSGISLSRIAPTGAVTGIILQAGTFGGQEIMIVNESTSANSVTFAATSSNVADGSSDVINGGTARKFVWDAGTSLWYRIQ